MENWKKHFSMKKTTRRYILSFLAVLILPMICFVLTFQQSFRDTYRGKIIEQAQSNLDITGSELDRKVESLHTLVEYNTIDKKLSKAVRQGALGVETVQDTLLAILANYLYVEDVYYYNPANPQTVYSSTGTYTTYYFAKIEGEMETEQQLLGFFDDIKWAELHPLGTNLVYVVRDVNASWWIFALDMTELKGQLLSERAVARILDKKGVVLYEVGNCGASDCYEIHYISSRNTFELIRSIDEKYLFGELDRWQRNFVLVVILILVAGGVLVLILTYYNGKPIKMLFDYSRKKIQTFRRIWMDWRLF